jgi:hypothetical protein
MAVVRKRVAYSSQCFQSAITTGKKLFNADGRSAEARRWRDVYQATRAQVDPKYDHLARSLASLVVQREALDAALVAGQPIDVDLLVRLAGAISRVMTKLGIVQTPQPRSKWDSVLDALREPEARA